MHRVRILLGFLLVVVVIAAALVTFRLLQERSRARNADWTPVRQEFDGVPMMLVPAGCFMMGSDTGGEDEQPVHEQCFDMSFYIDETEVTQVQFARLGGVQPISGIEFAGDNRPVENVKWIQARDFCLLRGGRLPTEAEWEYAARGPDALIFPWGNAWNAANAVWFENSNNQTAMVGGIPAGASWVGALDMAGNLWEFTNSSYTPYPHDAADIFAADKDDEEIITVIRGGGWNSREPAFMRLHQRRREYLGLAVANIGFRCVRSAERAP